MIKQITRTEKEFRIPVASLLAEFCLKVSGRYETSATIDVDPNGVVLVLKITEQPDESFPSITRAA